MVGALAAGAAGLAFLFSLIAHFSHLEEASYDLLLLGLVVLSVAVFDIANRPRR